jgi:hypothetical protein
LVYRKEDLVPAIYISYYRSTSFYGHAHESGTRLKKNKARRKRNDLSRYKKSETGEGDLEWEYDRALEKTHSEPVILVTAEDFFKFGKEASTDLRLIEPGAA